MTESWQEMLEEVAKEHGDPIDDIVWSISKKERERQFDSGFGCFKGTPFHAWTKNRIYFSVGYDGAEWVGSVPRNPSKEKPIHHGGG